jgi:hypothetical protein
MTACVHPVFHGIATQSLGPCRDRCILPAVASRPPAGVGLMVPSAGRCAICRLVCWADSQVECEGNATHGTRRVGWAASESWVWVVAAS